VKDGFTLIELVIAVAISSVIGLLLFRVLNQSDRLLTKVNSIVATNMNIVAFYDRFEKDICGAFIPVIGDLDRAKKVLAKHESDVRTREVEQGEGGEEGKKEAPKEPIKPVTLRSIQVKNPFIYEQKGNSLSRFSCVTSNPLQVYKQVKPRIARVVYTLQPDPSRPKTYKLLRKESIKLDLGAEKTIRAFTLLHNVRSLRLEFLAVEPEKKEKPDEEKQKPGMGLSKKEKDSESKKEEKKQEKPKPLKKYNKWPVKSEKKDEEPRDLPQFVNVFLEYFDPYEEVSRNYNFVFPLFNYKAPSEAVLNIPLMLQERLKKDEDEEPEAISGKSDKKLSQKSAKAK